MTVTITAASRSDEGVIQNLVQLYTHDFSEYWRGTTRGNLLPNGLFEAYPLEEYWTRGDWPALLVWCDGILTGFSLINNKGHLDGPIDRNMAEFFILRKYRGLGVGRLAAEAIFNQYPGMWQVAVTRKNIPAGVFWRKVIGGSPHVTGYFETDINTNHWNGFVMRFRWGAV